MVNNCSPILNNLSVVSHVGHDNKINGNVPALVLDEVSVKRPNAAASPLRKETSLPISKPKPPVPPRSAASLRALPPKPESVLTASAEFPQRFHSSSAKPPPPDRKMFQSDIRDNRGPANSPARPHASSNPPPPNSNLIQSGPPPSPSHPDYAAQFVGEWRLTVPLEKFAKLDSIFTDQNKYDFFELYTGYSSLKLQSSTKEFGAVVTHLTAMTTFSANTIEIVSVNYL